MPAVREMPTQGWQRTRRPGIDDGGPTRPVQDRTRNDSRAILEVQIEVRHASGKRLHHVNLIEMVLGSGVLEVLGSGELQNQNPQNPQNQSEPVRTCLNPQNSPSPFTS